MAPITELCGTKYRDDITNLGRFLEGNKGLKEILCGNKALA